MKKPNSPSPFFAIFRHYSPFFAIGPPPVQLNWPLIFFEFPHIPIVSMIPLFSSVQLKLRFSMPPISVMSSASNARSGRAIPSSFLCVTSLLQHPGCRFMLLQVQKIMRTAVIARKSQARDSIFFLSKLPGLTQSEDSSRITPSEKDSIR